MINRVCKNNSKLIPEHRDKIIGEIEHNDDSMLLKLFTNEWTSVDLRELVCFIKELKTPQNKNDSFLYLANSNIIIKINQLLYNVIEYG